LAKKKYSKNNDMTSRNASEGRLLYKVIIFFSHLEK